MAKRRLIGILIAIPLLFLAYRVIAVYTIQYGECRPKPVDPNLRLLTRNERGQLVSYPERINFPQQTRPLLVMTYNISGHDQLYDAKHLEKILGRLKAISGVREVVRKYNVPKAGERE